MTDSKTLELQRTIEMCVQRLDFAGGATLLDHARSTIAPSGERFGAERASAVLERLRGGAEHVVLRELIGEGGMGVVHAATQVALGRVVAVKRVREGSKQERALVAEALIAGALEHPNVIPVYDMYVDDAGAPALVMKRIDGEPWSRLLLDEDAVAARSELEPILFHLKVFAEVCDAVHFAHSRQVIHRDIKPQNVLVGQFGEVYLADWGIATAPGRVTRIAGTPSYMAPEMLTCDELTARTDVYLLGAVLFEILAGRAPHQGTSDEALLSNILLSEPDVPASAPDELADLVRACMAREPSARPESARAVRDRVDAFLEHRGSTELATRADVLAADVASEIARDAPRSEIYETFTECRFAYREALRSWSDNARAKSGLQSILHTMLSHEIARGDLAAVKLLAGEVADLSPETRAAIDALETRERAHAERLERLSRLEHELDPRVGRRARLTVAVGVGLLWTLLPLIGRFVGIHFGQLETLVALPVTLAVLAIFALTGRLAGWRASQLNRRLVRAFGFILLVEGIGAAVLYELAIPNRFVGRGLFFYWFVATGIVAATLDARLFAAAFAYLAGFVVVLEYPAARYVCATAVNLVLTIVTALVWLRAERRDAKSDAYAASRDAPKLP